MKTCTMYEYFGVSEDCTDRELLDAYGKKASDIMYAYINGKITREEMESETNTVTNSFSFLSKNRAMYDKIIEIDKNINYNPQYLESIEEVRLQGDAQDEDDYLSVVIPKRIADGFGKELLKMTLPLVIVFFLMAFFFMNDKFVYGMCIFFGALCSGVSIGKYMMFKSVTKDDDND